MSFNVSKKFNTNARKIHVNRLVDKLHHNSKTRVLDEPGFANHDDRGYSGYNVWIIDCGTAGLAEVSCQDGYSNQFVDRGIVSYGGMDCISLSDCCIDKTAVPSYTGEIKWESCVDGNDQNRESEWI